MLRPRSTRTEVKVIPLVLSSPGCRCPEVVPCAKTAVGHEQPGVLCPVRKIWRGKGIKISLVFEGYGSRWEESDGVFVYADFGARIEAWEERLMDYEIR